MSLATYVIPCNLCLLVTCLTAQRILLRGRQRSKISFANIEDTLHIEGIWEEEEDTLLTLLMTCGGDALLAFS